MQQLPKDNLFRAWVIRLLYLGARWLAPRQQRRKWEDR